MEHPSFRTYLGSIIKATRLRQNLSQYTLAEAAGVGRRYIQRLENGHQEATLSTFCLLAQALNTPPHILMIELEYAMAHGHLSEVIEKTLPPKTIGRPRKKVDSILTEED
ncbi:MAG: helix-turn-helix transcriptional regulator [Pseudomonadota bacterium]